MVVLSPLRRVITVKISTRGTYAVRLLVDLVRHGGSESYVCLGDISRRQGISRKYLEQIVPLLCKGGVLEGCRGHMGGYRLAKKAEEISAADILRMTEGSLAPVSCLHTAKECAMAPACPAYPVWKGLEKVITDYLEGIMLSDMITDDIAADGICPPEAACGDTPCEESLCKGERPECT